MMAPLESKYIKTKVSLLKAGIQMSETRSEQTAEIEQYLKAIEHDPVFQIDPEFPTGLDWFNSPALSFTKALQGKMVVLDFFTYCCVNCLHVLPDLAKLEETYGSNSGLCVIGVHSAKFANEKLSRNISDAILRNDIHHPVVNDSDIVLWERLGVVCWPTLVIIGPDCQLLYYIIGEGHGSELQLFVEVAMEYFSGRLNTEPLEKEVGRVRPEGGVVSILNYPGKVCTDDDGETVFVSDTGNNRILVAERKTGVVYKVYGSGGRGFKDGVGVGSEFKSPQGLVWHNNTLYVADTENHAIRKIDLLTHHVTTIAGTGCQGNDKEGGGSGRGQALSSPWDVAIQDDVLFIAMAGTHQIWAHFLEDKEWIKKSRHVAGTTVRFSGSGEEGNRNNSYPHKASFAQPSGVSLAGSVLYVADSESSSVRMVELASGAAKAVVGGAMDPLDLFAFGDVDGKAREVRLQHPLGVAWNAQNGRLYVADSYNHKIKEVNPAAKVCVTLAGTGESGVRGGSCDLAQFSEPSGLCVEPGGKSLLVADSNNHVIRVVNLESAEVSQFHMKFPEAMSLLPATPFQRLTRKHAPTVKLDDVMVKASGTVGISLEVAPPTNCHWTEEAPSAWQIMPGAEGDVMLQAGQRSSGPLCASSPVCIMLDFTASSELMVEVVCYFCEASGVCHMHDAVLAIPLVASESADSHVTKTFTYSPQQPKTI